MNPQSLSTLQAPTPATLKTNTLQSVQTILNYKFTNQALTWEALQAGGSSFPSEGTQVDGGKRLAIVGDVVLKLALMEDWYHSGASKARANQIEKQVAVNPNLDRVGKGKGLDQYVNRQGTGASGEVSWKTMADAMEAILGAVYFDGGLGAVKRVMVTLGLVPT